MKFTQSLRWRLQFWHSLLLAIALSGFGVLAHRLQKSNDLKRIDSALEREVNVVVASMRDEARPPRRQTGQRPLPRPRRPRAWRDFIDSGEPQALLANNDLENDYIVVWRRDGSKLGTIGNVPGNVPFPTDTGTDAAVSVQRTRDGCREVYRFLKPGECLLLGKSIQAESQAWQRLAWQLAGGGFGILALGLIGGWFFVARAIRPIQSISQSARRFANGELDTRIPEEDASGELGQLTLDLNDTYDQLEQAFARQGRFTADAAHELRTPVAVILSQAQAALLKDREAPAYKSALLACERGAKRLQQLIDSLLTLTSLDAQTNTVPMENIDLASLAAESAEFMKPLLANKGLVLETALAPALSKGRIDQLQQVLINLLNNAISFSESGKAIKLTSGQEDGKAWLSVSDQGKGIAEEHLPHLFERFYRADAARKRDSDNGGAGLGLAICHEIIEQHDGVIEVESDVGVGTTFTVRLPKT